MGKCVMNCETCDHKKHYGGADGYCYMWREEPEGKCYQHTKYKANIDDSIYALVSVVSLLQGRT